jgi:hypothetical protein
MITLTREEAQQVLDVIERNIVGVPRYRATELLRARLSAPKLEKKKYTEESCPVCGYYCLGKGGVNCIDKPKLCGINTAPPQREWQSLTDEERTYLAWESNNGPHCVAMTEAKLKEKNT